MHCTRSRLLAIDGPERVGGEDVLDVGDDQLLVLLLVVQPQLDHGVAPGQPHRFSPRLLKILPTVPASNEPEYATTDLAVQLAALPPVAANLGLNIDGLGQGQYGFVLNFSPPDSNGAVGATQYVQWVNAEFAVFDKVTGALVAGT